MIHILFLSLRRGRASPRTILAPLARPFSFLRIITPLLLLLLFLLLPRLLILTSSSRSTFTPRSSLLTISTTLLIAICGGRRASAFLRFAFTRFGINDNINRVRVPKNEH